MGSGIVAHDPDATCAGYGDGTARRRGVKAAAEAVPSGRRQLLPLGDPESLGEAAEHPTESLALNCWGVQNAPELIAQLIGAVAPTSIVAFHGVNNAAPVLALRTIHSLQGSPQIVFTDNLARKTRHNVATLLPRRHGPPALQTSHGRVTATRRGSSLVRPVQ